MKKRLIEILLVLALLATVPTALSKKPDGRSADAAAATVTEATGGRVLSVRRKGEVYRVKVLTDGGRVRVYRVDARTGRIKR